MCTDFGFTPRSGIECELLRLYIMSGHDLAFGDGDMYVKFNLMTNKGQKVGVSIVTEVDKDTSHPKWNEMFIVKVSPADHKLQMQVYSRHSALKLEKSAISKVQKKHYLHFQKWQKINFCTRKMFKATKNPGFFSVRKLHFW